MTDLPVAVAVLFERPTEEFQLLWEIVIVAHGSSSVYQGWQHRMFAGRVLVRMRFLFTVCCKEPSDLLYM
jgi:hypothetical protein